MDGRDAMLAVAMNGEPLPLAHGFPVRMIVPGLYGYVSATKWLVDIELTTFDAFDPYWVPRGWAEQAPIKTMSRIDTPAPFAEPRAGEVPIAGVAWAQHVGIDRRGGPRSTTRPGWRPNSRARTRSIPGGSGSTGGTRPPASTGYGSGRPTAPGPRRPPSRAEPFPDGATGHHEIVVRVG